MFCCDNSTWGEDQVFTDKKYTDFNLLPSSFFASHHSFPESPAALCHLVPPWGASTLRNPPLTWGRNVNWAEVTSWEAHLSFLHFCHILLSPGQLNLLFVLLCHCTPLLSWRLRPVQKIFFNLFCTFFTRVTATVSQHNSRVPTPCRVQYHQCNWKQLMHLIIICRSVPTSLFN